MREGTLATMLKMFRVRKSNILLMDGTEIRRRDSGRKFKVVYCIMYNTYVYTVCLNYVQNIQNRIK
jgi:hypothetical protein